MASVIAPAIVHELLLGKMFTVVDALPPADKVTEARDSV